MNPPARDATPLAAPPTAQAAPGRADTLDFWDALWTLDEEWHPEPTPFGGDPTMPEFVTVL